jgi:hypothetical protein
MRLLPLAVSGAVLAAAVGTGCARPPARIEPEPPLVVALLPPPPPPRVIELYPDEQDHPDEVEDVAEEAPAVPQKPQVSPPPPATAPPVSTPEPPRSAAEPGLVLRAAGANQRAVEATRELLARASRDLSRVNYQVLGRDGRVQYDTARRFMQQAEDALAVGNLMFAGKLADKAASMAAILVR